MSVIPLTLEGGTPSLVDTAEEFHQAGDIEGHTVLIKGLDRNQLASGSRNSNVSYDLRVGHEYRDHRETGKRDLRHGEELRILPGMAVIVETLEELHLPRSVFGVTVPKVSLSQQGLTNTASKVDPGYAGRLLVTTYNLGKGEVRLRPGDVLCSIYFLDVQPGGRVYEKPAKKLEGQPTGGRWSTARYRLEANAGAWIVLLSIFTAISIVVSTVTLIMNARR